MDNRFRHFITSSYSPYWNLFVLLTLLLSPTVAIPVHGAHGHEADILKDFHLRPGSLFPGAVAQVSFRLAPGYHLQGLRFNHSKIPVRSLGNGKFMALIGVGLKDKPGKIPLFIHVIQASKGHSNRITIRKAILIRSKRYPSEYLKVAKRMVSFPPPILKRVLADQRAIRRACNKITPVFYWKVPFIWPVHSKILSPFGLRRYFNGQPRSPHSGLDQRARLNTPIRCPNFGVVSLVRNCYLSGNTVVIDHGGGLYTLFAHLNKVMVAQGERVKRGQIIGLSGASGRATGPHLHWGVSLLGKRVDPAEFMELLGEKKAAKTSP